MRSMRCLAWIAAIATILAAWPTAGWAIPAFARKYGFSCTMCHVQFPRLNDFGERFRDNGYHVMGKEAEDMDVMDAAVPPISARTMIGYFNNDVDNPGSPVDNDLNQFQIDGLDLFAGGVMSPSAGFFLAYLPRIDGSRGVAPQDARLEQGNVVLIMRKPRWMGNLRVGRFEPAYVPISALRTYTGAPYEILDFPGVIEMPLAQTQTGLELAARVDRGWRFAGGFVDGSDSLEDNDSPNTFYVRASKSFRGDGANSGYRVGAQALTGKARAALTGDKEDWTQWAVDTSLVFGPTTVLAQFAQGTADRRLNVFNTARDYDWNGFFVEVDHALCQTAVAFARYDLVDTPSEQNQNIARWTIGARQYLMDHIAVALEYSQQKTDHAAVSGGDLKSDNLSLAFDMAF